MKTKQAFFLALFAAFVSHPSVALDIEVYVASPNQAPLRLPGHTVTVFDLSEPERVKQQLPDLPDDPDAAMAAARQFFSSQAGQRFKMQLNAAYSGHKNVMRYGIEKVPAVVFDEGRYVIYGTTDLNRALRDYYAYQSTQENQ